jgi:hypothetical protein
LFSLQQYQVESAALYVTSFSGGIFGAAVLVEVLNGFYIFGQYSQGIAVIIIVVAISVFFVAVSKVVHEVLKQTIGRMGSDRPVSLHRGSVGWDSDPSHGFYHYLLLGEVDFEREKDDDDIEMVSKRGSGFDAFACGCLSTTMELAIFPFGRFHRTADDDRLSEDP